MSGVFSRQYRLPIKQPYQLIEDPTGVFELVLARALAKNSVNRMCLPANYAVDRLYNWNQKNYAGVDPRQTPWAEAQTIGPSALGLIGQTTILSGSSVTFHTLNYSYAREPTINTSEQPSAYFNWVHDKTNKKFSFEFYLDNDLEETSPTVIYDDDESFWTLSMTDSGTLAGTLSEETTEVKKGTSSLKLEVTDTGTYGRWRFYHNYGAGQDWSSKEFMGIWFYGANSGTDIDIICLSSDWSNYFLYTFTDNFTGWKRMVIPFEKFTITGSASWSAIWEIWLQQQTGSTGTWYLDRTVIDVGQSVIVEIFVPDELNQGGGNRSIQLSSWDGSQWVLNYKWDDSAQTGVAYIEFLNGDNQQDIFGQARFSEFPSGYRGETKTKVWGTDVSNITYSSNYGCKKRIGFAIRMPPHDGLSSEAGGDSSTTGISQCKLKLEVYYSSAQYPTIAKDTSGQGNNGTVYGLPAFVGGKFGQALDFETSQSDYIGIADDASLRGMTELTLEAWIKGESHVTYMGVIANWVAATHYILGYFESPDGKLGKFKIFVGGTGGSDSLQSNTNLELNTWYHIVGVAKCGEYMKVYINAVEDNSKETCVVTQISDVADEVLLGRYADYYFDGIIDEVRIYNRVLSQPEIEANMAGNVTKTGLVGEWKFDGESCYFGETTYEFEDSTNQYYGLRNLIPIPDTILDTSGQGNHGTNNGALLIEAPRTDGKLLEFDGNDYVDCDNDESLRITPNQTVELWIYSTTSNTEIPIMKKYNDSLDSYGWALYLWSGVRLYMRGHGSTGFYAVWTKNTWHHVVAVWEGTSGKIYIDSASNETSGTIGQIDNTYMGNLKMGGPTSYFTGKIDDVRIWNRVLNTSEIENIFNNNPPTNGLVGEWKFERMTFTNYQSYGPWLALFNTTTKEVIYAILSKRLTGLEVTADEDENITKVKMMSWKTDNLARDTSENGNDGTINGCKTLVDGVFNGHALNFDGNDYVDLGNVLNFGNVSFSIESWFKLVGSATYRTIVAKGHFGFGAMYILLANNTGNLRAYLDDGTYNVDIVGDTNVFDGKWHHSALVRDKVAGKVILYLDGAFEKDASDVTGDLSNAYSLKIGTTAAPAYYMDGIIDEVRIHNRALSQSEINDCYNNNPPTNGLVGEWKFEPQSKELQVYIGELTHGDLTRDGDGDGVPDFLLGNLAKDTSGEDNQGTLINTPVSANGRYGWGMSFNSDDSDRIDITDDATLQIGTGNFTVMAWIKSDATMKDGYPNIICKGVGIGAGEWMLRMIGSSGVIQFYGDESNINIQGSTDRRNAWHHLCFVRDGDTGYLYVDGVQEATPITGIDNVDLNTTDTLCIGGASTRYWDGIIDEARLYKRALSQSEVQSAMNGNPSATNLVGEWKFECGFIPALVKKLHYKAYP